jgi:hypothetical protein
MIPPPVQRTMSERAASTVVEAADSHSIYISHPAAEASLIEQAASATTSAGGKTPRRMCWQRTQLDLSGPFGPSSCPCSDPTQNQRSTFLRQPVEPSRASARSSLV